MALIGRNVRVEVSKMFALAPFAITGADATNPVLIHYTSSDADPANGDVILLPAGFSMPELHGQPVRVAAVDPSANTFMAQGLDGTTFTAFTGSTTDFAQAVSAWSTLGIARSLNSGGTSPAKIDATTLIDTEKQTLFGLSDNPEITVDALSNPLTEAAQIVENAARLNSLLVFRVTFMQTGEKRLFAGYVSLPTESIPLGELVTSSFSITQQGRRLAFAS